MADKKEMTVVEFLSAWGRMCKQVPYSCRGCAIQEVIGSAPCKVWVTEHPEEAVAIVQKWAEENPVKTFLSDLLEKYPKIPLEPDGTPDFCPHALGYCESRVDCPPLPKEGCYKCWSKPLEG